MRKLFFLLLILPLSAFVYGQAGTPDPFFGSDGFIATTATQLGNTSSLSAKEAFVTTTGEILLVMNYRGKTLLTKRLSTGKPDLNYGKNGYSVVVSMIVTAAAIQPDGKIVVAGATDGVSNFTLA